MVLLLAFSLVITDMRTAHVTYTKSACWRQNIFLLLLLLPNSNTGLGSHSGALVAQWDKNLQTYKHMHSSFCPFHWKCPLKWFRSYLHNLVGWLYSRWWVILGSVPLTRPSDLCCTTVEAGSTLGVEGPWEDVISESWMVSWKNWWGPQILGSLCCSYCCLSMLTSPLFILCSMTIKPACFPSLF